MSDASDGRNAFRERLVARQARWYSPSAHLLVPALGGLGLIAACLLLVRQVTLLELGATVAWLVACNAIEWNIHRHLLHHRRWVFYDKHTPEHHGVFREHDMEVRSRREFALVLIPGYAVVALFLLFLPVATLLMLVSFNLGLLFYAATIFYILAYEWMHLLYHLPVRGRGWPAPLEALRQHHATHHDPKLMQEWNFNTTFPLWDWVKGTRYRGSPAGRGRTVPQG